VGDHSSRPAVADRLKRPTRPHPPGRRLPAEAKQADCLVLHAVGFALPRLSPAERCALTAPFHPYLYDLRLAACGLHRASRESQAASRHRRFVFCGTGPSASRRQDAGWALPTTEPCRVRTFLPATKWVVVTVRQANHRLGPFSGGAIASVTHRKHYTSAHPSRFIAGPVRPTPRGLIRYRHVEARRG